MGTPDARPNTGIAGRPLRFCMVSTFFGAESFGGDAVYIERLSQALLRRGHAVDVIHCPDAFEAVRRGQAPRIYTPPAGLRVHALRSTLDWYLRNPLRLGKNVRNGAATVTERCTTFGDRIPRIWPLLWTHQTGRLGPLGSRLRRILAAGDYDVIHFHNISLIGGPAVLGVQPRRPAVKIMTAHEWWLMCPLSSLWKFDRGVCQRPQCVRCTLMAGRPPQLWRSSASIANGLNRLDALLFPSRFALEMHRAWGIDAPRLIHLPHFLPDARGLAGERASSGRPYFACAGRLVREKGFQQVIPLMARWPEVDLKIAGAGPLEGELRTLAARAPNVHFLGLLSFPELTELYRGARAVIAPSQYYETFGFVVLEAFSTGTPVIVHDCGALPELIQVSGGGLSYKTDEELLGAMRSLAHDDALRGRLGEKGQDAVRTVWSEQSHVDAYLALVERLGV
jgi:glycosyltransferase involved in cell wall biosynthesis